MSLMSLTRRKIKAKANRKRQKLYGIPPMVKLLKDNIGCPVEVAYEQQWRTFFKAERLGYIAETSERRGAWITAKGEAFLADYEKSKI